MAELHVSKKNISKLLSEMQGKKFVIPDFQRPYNWEQEKCETLWDDIVTFLNTEANESDYFLGTIVSYINGKNIDIIDGQQRITSFFLLLRAFYRKLEDMPADNPNVIGLKNQVAPCIWDVNRISQEIKDKSIIHIESLVATAEDNDVFHNILITGHSSEDAKDNYSVNYRYFKKQCDSFAERNPLDWEKLCVTILQQCVVLPIECDTPEIALTIFSTLNDRGMPLADSDIFKAQIYRSKLESAERKEYTDAWKELTSICKKADLSIDDVFRYYTHVLRARRRDKSKEVGLRRFYAENSYATLRQNGLMDEIMILAKFWLCLNRGVAVDEYSISLEARKYIQCLEAYPNEFWKYPISVFFLKHKEKETFATDFVLFLKQLVAFLFVKFIESPTVNAIKDDVYALYIAIDAGNVIKLNHSFNDEMFNIQLPAHSTTRLARALLLLDAYLFGQETLVTPTFDVEHIFPQKWQNTNYNGWNEEDAKVFLELFGNKIVIEKKLNIQAGNGYFGRKKAKYAQSSVGAVLALSNYPNDDWNKDDILQREKEMATRLVEFFKAELTASTQP